MFITFEDKKYRVIKSKFYKNAKSYIGIPGQVLFKRHGFLVIKTKDSIIDIFIEEFSTIKIGSRLI